MEQKSNGAKSDRATERQSNVVTEQQSGGAKSDGVISLYIKIEKRKNSNCVGIYGWSERDTDRRAME